MKALLTRLFRRKPKRTVPLAYAPEFTTPGSYRVIMPPSKEPPRPSPYDGRDLTFITDPTND